MSRIPRNIRLIALTAAGAVGIGSFLAGQLPASAASTVAVNAGTTYQHIDGLGSPRPSGRPTRSAMPPAVLRSRRWTCSSGDWRQAYATYLVQHAKYWSSVGLTPSAVGFVNEPSLKTSYSSVPVSTSQAASFMPRSSSACSTNSSAELRLP